MPRRQPKARPPVADRALAASGRALPTALHVWADPVWLTTRAPHNPKRNLHHSTNTQTPTRTPGAGNPGDDRREAPSTRPGEASSFARVPLTRFWGESLLALSMVVLVILWGEWLME